MNSPDPVPPPVTPLPSWRDSYIVKALLSALAVLILAIAGVFVSIDEIAVMAKVEKVITALTAFLSIGVPIGMAIWARLKRATPPITQTAVAKTAVRELEIAAAPEHLKEEAAK